VNDKKGKGISLSDQQPIHGEHLVYTSFIRNMNRCDLNNLHSSVSISADPVCKCSFLSHCHMYLDFLKYFSDMESLLLALSILFK